MNNSLTGLLSTYVSPESLGIYRFTIDLRNGVVSYLELYYEIPNCKLLPLKDSLLASPLKREGRSGICLLDMARNEDNASAPLAAGVFKESSSACRVVRDDHYIYAANYREGTILVCEIEYRAGSYGRGKRPTRSYLELVKRVLIVPRTECHQILFHDHYTIVPCLLLDKVTMSDCQKDLPLVSELAFDTEIGLRRGISDRNHKQLFLVSEPGSQVSVYSLTGGAAAGTDSGHNCTSLPDFPMRLLYIRPILPSDAVYEESPTSAAIRLSPGERFLYVSTRSVEVIVVFKIDHGCLAQIQQTGRGGVHPRDMILTLDDRYLLVANRIRGDPVSFRTNQETDRPMSICSRVPAPETISTVLSQHTI